MVTTGGSEALLFGLNSCLDAGDEIIIPEPFYANYNGFSISAGVTVKPLHQHQQWFCNGSLKSLKN